MDNIVADTLNTLSEYLVRLDSGIRKAVDSFRSQREGEGLELLMQIIEGVDWCVQVITRTEYLFKNNGIDIYNSNINDKLKDLENSLKNEDYVFAADLLEYEMIDVIVNWQDALRRLPVSN